VTLKIRTSPATIHPIPFPGATISSATSTSSSGKLPQTLFGYTVVSKIGEGAGSTLYAVTDAGGQIFALKHVIKKTDKDQRFLDQLTTEHEMTRLFRHPVLRKTIDLKFPRRFFSNKVDEAALILEWVDGEGLDERPASNLPTLLGIFTHCAAALASMHKLRLVHCDFKPHNVLINSEGKVKLIDFGQTCKTGMKKDRVQGTPDFITPEQVKLSMVDEKTDIYSLAASLYWTLTGTKVPTYMTVDKADRDIIKLQQFPSPRDLKPELPEAMSDFLMRCLRYNPDRRPADMLTVMNQLESFAKGLT
jgi:serine/threonine-protein kinase